MHTEISLGPTRCRYCNGRLPPSGETIELDGTIVTLRKPGRPRVQCGAEECVRAMQRDYSRRYRTRKAMAG